VSAHDGRLPTNLSGYVLGLDSLKLAVVSLITPVVGNGRDKQYELNLRLKLQIVIST
jgi:hypothetical protein